MHVLDRIFEQAEKLGLGPEAARGAALVLAIVGTYNRQRDERADALLAENKRLLERIGTGDMSKATADVIAERRRQVEIERWPPGHDDDHRSGEIAAAAAAYAFSAFKGSSVRFFAAEAIGFWPWEAGWFKPTTPRRDLIKAGALIIAEIERLDRADDAALADREC